MKHIKTKQSTTSSKGIHHHVRRAVNGIRPKNRWHKFLWVSGFIVATFLSTLWIIGTYYRNHQQDLMYRVGLSFSVPYAQELGLDWRAAYSSILTDLNPDHVRLMSYWDKIEPSRGSFDFADLDWQMDQAAAQGVKVTMAIGERQPRWPECHTPEWAEQLDVVARRKAVLDYTAKVVERYRTHPALESWQLENEYFNRNFGKCKDFSRERLTNEFDAVKNLDPDHPVILSFADQLGFPLFGPVPDSYATSLYTANYVKKIGYFAYPIPWYYYSAKAQLIGLLHNRRVFIHELQLEPWGPRSTAQLTIAEQDQYMDTSSIRETVKFGKSTGMTTIDMWGAEWWYWRKNHLGDPSVWETIKDEINKLQTERQCSSVYSNPRDQSAIYGICQD